MGARNLIALLLLLSVAVSLVLLSLPHAAQAAAAEDTQTPDGNFKAEDDNDDDGDSSSDETMEDSTETRRRKRYAEPLSDTGNASGQGREDNGTPRAVIPGLPDPATIIKIAEILQAVGEKVIPLLVEGISGAAVRDFLQDDDHRRHAQDYAFLGNFKNDLDAFTHNVRQL